MTVSQSLTLGALLKEYRRRLGLTQEELADRARLSSRTVRDLERGVHSAPHRETLDLLAAALQLDAQDRAMLASAVIRLRAPTQPATGARRTDESTASFSASAASSLWSGLPTPLTPLVGREREEAAVSHVLSRDDVRLLTLTGPAGIGKTRLAVQVAASLRDFFCDGVVFVPLAAVREPDLVLVAIARALGLRESGTSLLDALLVALTNNRVLLVLDNFEQIVRAAPDVVRLLEVCTEVKALVTSRATLHVRGEHEFTVPPLKVPDEANPLALDDLTCYPAVALFVARSRAVRPLFELTGANAPHVAEICRRLEGIPLAIELAAARIKVLSPQALLKHLDRRLHLLVGGPQDLPERQQTMRSAVEWSYALLGGVEQLLFRRLCVFAGSCMSSAIEAVCNADGALRAATPSSSGSTRVFDTLQSLVDKSLVACDAGDVAEGGMAGDEGTDSGARFRLLALIREFGLEQLAISGEEMALQLRYADYYLAVAEQAEPHLRGPEQARWLAILEREHDNLRAALGWSLERGMIDLGLRLAGALWWFWYVRGHLSEGRGWLEALLSSRASDAPPTASPVVAAPARAKALYGAGMIVTEQGDYAQAAALVRESEGLFRSAGDDRGLAMALNVGGNIAKYQGDFAQATALYQECLALRRALGDRSGTAVTLNNLGTVAIERGESERARELYEESLAIKRELGDKRGIAVALLNLGDVARDLGDPLRAIHLLEESLTLFRELEDTRGVALALTNLGEAARDQGDRTRASETSTESLALFEQLGDKWGIALALNNLGDIAQDQGALAQAIELYRRSLALYLAKSNKVGIAECLEALAGVARTLGQPERAARLWGRAAALRDAASSSLPAVDRGVCEHEIAALREWLGEEAFAVAWARGQTLTLQQVFADLADISGS